LTGRYRSPEQLPADDFRRAQPRWRAGNFAANVRAFERLRELTGSWGVTAAQLAIAWLLRQGEDVVALVGCTRVATCRRTSRGGGFLSAPGSSPHQDLDAVGGV